MLTRDEALNLLALALQHSTADQTEVMLTTGDEGITRLANGGIHQNVAIADVGARVRAVVGKRIGVATANILDGNGLRALVDRAIRIARVCEPNPDFHSLPEPETITGLPASAISVTPEERADAAGAMIATARGNGVTAAGHVTSARRMLAIGNSLGVRAHHAWTESTLMAIMTRGDASGYAQWSGTTLADAPAAEIAAHAAEKCLAGDQPGTIEPGRYTVILEPPAVAEMLSMLAMMGLGATPFQEGRSFMSGKIGEPLAGANISLADDAYHPLTVQIPFDYEGVPKHVVPIFEHGTAKGVVYDSYTAQREGRHSTGHALPAPNAYGPVPLHLVLHGGTESRDSLLAGVERGILVTRFHYVNIVHPTETIFTGMTRDGTFLIEHGTVTRAVNKLRFTQSILEALCHVSSLERDLTLVNQEGLYCVVPTLRIEGFNFTSASPS
jgi:predicted Zn-dependent protease